MNEQSTYFVTGMSCTSCANALTKRLTVIDGVSEVTIDLATETAATVVVTSRAPVGDKTIRAAIDDAGYVVVERSQR